MAPKEKTLDYEPPLLTSYPHVASLCAMLGNNPWLMPEMVNELVGLVYDREIDRIDFSISLDILSYMKNYPLMYTHAVSRSFVQKNWRRFSEFVEAAIADGYYVHCLLDTFYVSAYRETYQREHYLHNAMIYGYSRQDRTMLLADAFEKGKYERRTASYAEIDSAMLSSHVGDWLDGILLCKRKEDPFSPVAYHTDYIKKKEYAAAYLLGEELFEVYLTVPGKEKLVTLYFTDYDGMARSMEIAATGTGGHVYDTCLVESSPQAKCCSIEFAGAWYFVLQECPARMQFCRQYCWMTLTEKPSHQLFEERTSE